MDALPVLDCSAGVDIAATTFTVAWALNAQSPSAACTFEQTPAGFAAFQARLPQSVPPSQTLIVMEATSTYWIRLAVTLHEAGYRVAVLNPKHLHNYAKSLPRRSKTDALDAQLLVRFAQERQPLPWTPPPAVYHELRQRLMARDALLEMRQQARNQLHALSQWPVVVASVLAQFQTVMETLDVQLATLDQEIATTLHEGAWAASAMLLLSIPGIGMQCAAWLLITTFNFTLCETPQALVAYAGLSPLQRESGTSIRGRPHIGRGGHARLRKALYMAALSAQRYNSVLMPLYTRLRAQGKASKLARCAVARKLIHLAWAVVTKGQPFDPSYQASHRSTTSEQGTSV